MNCLHTIVALTTAILCVTAQGDAPSVSLLPEEETVSEGENIQLTCRVNNSAGLRVTWFRNGEELGPSGDVTRGIFIRPYRGGKSTLRIVDAGPSNVGEYHCKAVNDEGEDIGISIISIPTSYEVECVPEDQTFCLNGGTCLMYKGSDDPEDKFCRCTAEFEGDKCEHHSIDFDDMFDESTEWWAALSKGEVFAIVGCIMAVLVIVVFAAFVFQRHRRRAGHDSQGLTMDSVQQDTEKGTAGITNQAVEQSDRSWILKNGSYPKDAIDH